jgi:hypothetical protein
MMTAMFRTVDLTLAVLVDSIRVGDVGLPRHPPAVHGQRPKCETFQLNARPVSGRIPETPAEDTGVTLPSWLSLPEASSMACPQEYMEV